MLCTDHSYVCLHILVSAVIFLSEGSDDDVVTVL